MKQFTFSAQVANNLLTVLQGYSKTIRLLLVMFLTLTITTNAWGAEYKLVTSAPSDWSGEYLIVAGTSALSGGTSSWGTITTVTVTNNTISTIENISVTISKGGTSGTYYIYMNSNSKYLKEVTSNTFATADASSTDTEWKISLSNDGNAQIACASATTRYLRNNGTSGYRCYTSSTGTLPKLYKKVTAAYTITATSNNDSYGTVSVNGTTITATPKDGYRVKSGDAGYTVTSGTADVTNNGDNTFSVTPSSNCTITINFEAIPKYTVTWNVNGEVYETTQVTEGSKPTFPATPSSCDATSNTFYGWATATWDGKIDNIIGKTIYTSANDMPAVNGAVTYYAVFATKGASGGTAFDGTSGGDFKIYALVEGEKKYLQGTGSKISPVDEAQATEYTFTKISDGVFSIKTGTTYLTYASSSNLGTSNSAYSWTISTGTKGSWRIASTNTTSRGIVYRAGTTNQFGGYALSNITANGTEYYDVEIGGGASVSYSGYITTCAAGDPCASLQAPIVTPTATANSITLSWEAVDGAISYNVYNYTTEVADEVNVLTYTFNGLNSETEYSWEVEAVSATCNGKGTKGTTTTLAEAPTSYTITFETNGGTNIDKITDATALPDPLPTPTKTGYTFLGWYTDEGCTQVATAGATIDADITLYAKWTELPTYTVSFSTGTGNPTQVAIQETIGGAGITLPAGPTPACSTAGWEFAGWAEATVTETTIAPTLFAAGSNYKPASDCTLHAVYSKTEGGEGEELSQTLQYDTWSYSGSTTNKDDYRMFHSGSYIESESFDLSKLSKVVVYGGTFGGDSYNQLTIGDGTNVWKKVTVSGKSETGVNTYTDGNTLSGNGNLRITSNSGTASSSGVRISKIEIYTTSATTTYNSNPVCVASWSITYDFAGGTSSHCSDTSVPQGDQYIICDEAPTKEGHTFQGWSDGTNTHAAGATITPTKNITLTAQWQINTYTVTWSNNGTPTPVEYNHGDALVVLEAPESCDGVKEFVGWTEQSGYYHATTAPTDLFKTTTATVTADKDYYAVFATPGAGGTEFVLGESGTFKMYANVNGTNYYAQGGVNSSKITSTIEAANASDYTLTYADGSYTIKQGTSTIGHSSNADLSTTASTWTISAGTNGSWRVTSNVITSRALSYSTSAKAFKAYATSNITEGNETYFDIEFGSGSSGYSDYTTTCQQVESIEVQDNPKTEFNLTDDFTIGTGKVIATLSGGGTTDVTALATFSGYNMNVVGTYTVTVTYMGATATYEITVNPLDNAWVLTWNVSGKTNTGLGPRSVTKNSAIGTLPTPEVPAACAGKTFMGWTTSNIVHSDGTGITYITSETVPTDNTTYYAVFATINNFCSQKPIDQITSGSKVVIVAVASLTNDGGAGKAISSRATDDTHNLQGDSVAIYDETINTPHSTCIWTITESDGKYIFTQDDKYLNGIIDGKYSNLKYDGTSDKWTLTPAASGMERTYNMKSTNASTEYVEWYNGKFTIHEEVNANGAFDMQFFVTANAAGNADTTEYTTGCAEYTITYYGFRGGYSTSCSSDGTIVLPVNSIHTIPNCEGLVINDHTNLGRTFTGVWMTKPHGGHTFKPGDTFILTQDTTLYAQWKMETTSDVTTLPTDIEDLAGTDIYVYGGKTLTLQPGTTTINSLTLKGGLQEDGSYKMPTVWVPEGATLIRNSNKINLDLVVNAKNYYPFAVPFAAKNNANVEYLDPVLAAASTYGTHFVIKTYDGANRAKVGEDKTNNWVSVRRDSTLQPGVGYIITALTYPAKDTATIRIPMTVPDTWFNNGEQAAVGTTVRNTIAVTAHTGAAATKHQRHAGWNFVANPYLTNFTGGNVANDGDLAYINGELIIEGSYEYGGEDVPYVTIPAYNFASYSQHKLSDVKLSPEYSFFVQVVHGGTMNFTTAGRQQAPASIAARNAEERPVKMDVDLILSDNHSSDQTGIIISDRYTDAYEIGHDLEKLFGSAYNLSVYTLMADNTPLAFQALAIRSSMQVIPVGYRAPEQGEYTFRLNEATSSIDLLNEQYEQLVLVDYQTGELTNLLYTDYTFYSERTQSNARFAIYAVPRQNAPTDLPNAIGSDEEVRKVIYNDHLYILRDGNVYNGMGQKM